MEHKNFYMVTGRFYYVLQLSHIWVLRINWKLLQNMEFQNVFLLKFII